jgi:sugar phosphate permease
MSDPIGILITILLQIIFTNKILRKRAEEGADVDQVTVSTINQMLTMEGMFTIFVALIAINLIRDKPRLPPSKSSCIERTKRVSSLRDDLGDLFGNSNFRVFLVINTIVVSIYCSMGKVAVAIVEPFEFTPSEIAMFIFLNLVAGISSAMLSGVWIDKTQKFKMTTTTLLFLCVVGVVAMQVVLRMGNNALLYISGIINGIVQLPLLPINFAFAAELTYPVR